MKHSKVENNQICRACKHPVSDAFCSHCGEPTHVKRITLKGLLHDVFHFFTHVDKGFAYTLKQLAIAPGNMQRQFIEGNRRNHQKAFSMFFICATITAFSRYWILKSLNTFNGQAGLNDANFFHEYLVPIQIGLLPIIIFLAYVLFKNTKYNVAEIGVLILYTFSFFLLLTILLWLLRFIKPDLNITYLELPTITVYCSITFLNFFKEEKRWVVLVKSLLFIILVFVCIQFAEDIIESLLDKK
ncbi:MAG: DUF3667 domain-containing protein [Spirosomataceae bacterium]